VGDEQLPPEMKDGLYDKVAISKEINSFVEAVMKKPPESAREDL
jgi:hypothetical protein